MINVAINGFGRIGRLVFRALLANYKDQVHIVAINDLADAKALAHLLKYDSVYGRYPGEIKVNGDVMSVGGMDVKMLCLKKTPCDLPWKEYKVDIAIEATGLFVAKAAQGKDGYDGHLKAGARRVVLTAPAKDDIDVTIVMGVNDEALKPEHLCISNASCTTNCLAPVAHVLHQKFGIVKGLMTTVHAYTNDQRIADQIHTDLRRARHAALNVIPTSTGAAKAIGLVIPALNGKLDGLALRVPVPTGSMVDLTFECEKKVTKKDINAAIKEASETPKLKGILDYTEDEIVSTDIVQDSHSSIFDSKLTMVIGENLVKVCSWYDNEWGYSNRLADCVVRAAKQL